MRKLALVGMLLLTPLSRSSAQNVTISGTATLNATNALFGGFSVGLLSYSFTLQQSPVTTAEGAQVFRIGGVSGLFTQGAMNTTIIGEFRGIDASFLGGFTFRQPLGGTMLLNITSPQIYSGLTSAPTFLVNSYGGTSTTVDGDPLLVGGNFVIAASTVVPEPSTYALMGAGLLALGAVHRRRKYHVAV